MHSRVIGRGRHLTMSGLVSIGKLREVCPISLANGMRMRIFLIQLEPDDYHREEFDMAD